MRNQLIFFFCFSLVSANLMATNEKEVLLNLRQISTGLSDNTEIYFAQGTSRTYVASEDSKKNFDTLAPQIYSLTSDLVPCYLNGYGNFTGSVVITLGYQVEASGTYLLSASTVSNFADGSIILLEDRMLGTFTDLRQYADTVTIRQAGQNQERFYLHITYAPVLTAIAAKCNNDSGIIAVTEDSAIVWSAVLLFDSNSRLVASLSDAAAGFSFGNLTAGNYFMAFTYGSYTFVDPIYVASHQVLLSISAPVTEGEIQQTMQFYSNVNEATEYTWNFGDGSIITGIANPGYEYYQTGTYSVSLHAANAFECSADAFVTINVTTQTATAIANVSTDSINVFADRKNVIIAGNNATGTAYTCSIYNIAGQLLVTAPVTSSYFVLDLATEAAGIYLVQVKTETGSFTRKIFLGRS